MLLSNNQPCFAMEVTEFGEVLRCTFGCDVHCNGCSNLDPLFGNATNASTEDNSDTGISPVASAIQRRLDGVAGNGTNDLKKSKCDVTDLQFFGDDLSTVFCEEVAMLAEEYCDGTSKMQ